MDQQLRVRVLGGAELSVGERPLTELASAKAAALLFYLAVTGRGCSRSALAGLLWSDLPEATARANLRLVLTKLRRVLPEHVDVTRQTVGLAGDRPVWVDAVEVRRAAAADRGDDLDLLAAVRLCRGDFLEGFSVPGASLFDEWTAERGAAVKSDMLALMDRAVERARVDSDVPTGIEVARRMLGLERFHEEAHRALMWFMAVGGQRSAALAQYETCAYLFREELGIEPSAATIALRDEITGIGRFTGLRVPAAKSPAPGLPRPLTTLVGREGELRRLHELLDDPASRLTTLVGPGGIGKTRLAMEVATARSDCHRDGTLFVSFVGSGPVPAGTAADLVIADLARALGVSMAVPRDPLDLLAEHVAGRELLLVLDNLEHLRDAGGVLVELLRRAPGLQLLVTSRRPLGLGMEWLVEVPGLPYPPPGADGDAAGYEAVQLFEERARLLRPGVRATGGAASAEGVGRICRLVAGMPLAIELAARWVRSASPAAIADRLAQGLELLATTSPDVEPRHRSLRSVIDWSYQLLTEQERGVLRRLSVLRRGFDLAAAGAVAGAGLPLLAALVDQSLVAAGEDGRYEMHELLRQYAAERLAADPVEEAEARRRHAEHYAALLPAPAEVLVGVGRLDAEAENLRTATDWHLRNAEPAVLDSHLLRMWALYRRMGWFREAQSALVAALERPDITRLQQAHWHRLLGEVFQQLGVAEAARDEFRRALGALGSRVPSSTSGWLMATAVHTTRRALRRLRPGGAVEPRPERRHRAWERAAVNCAILEVYWVLDEYLLALPTVIWALNDAERAGDPQLLAMVQAGFGLAGETAGWHRTARRNVTAARAAAERIGDPLTACWVAILGGLHGLGIGDWAAVESGVANAVELARPAPLHRLTDQGVLIGAVACYLSSRYPQAAAAAAQAMASGRERHDSVVQMWGLAVSMETALRVDPGDPALAGWLAEATRLLPKVARIDAARLHAAAARLHLIAGRPADAWRAVRAADALLGPRRSYEPYALEALAGMAEVCLTLIEHAAAGEEIDPAELRVTAAASLRRLRRYARTFPMARPRAYTCLGWQAWLDGRAGVARRAWSRAIGAAERLQMPYELARAHYELGRRLAPDERSPLGFYRSGHLERALAAYRDAGCVAELQHAETLISG